MRRTEEEFADFIASELGFLTTFGHYQDEPLVLEPYQQEFLATTARWRAVEKSRQTGFSFIFAGESIARSHLRKGHTSVFVSYNRDDSKEKITYARQLFEELPLEYQKRLVIDSKTELGFESNDGYNKRISRIISHPSRAPRGKHGDIYLDELAHYINDREVYKGSTALIMRSEGQITICSSPLGRRGVFWEIARQEQKPYKQYWRQRVPWWLCSFFLRSRDFKFRVRASLEAPGMTTTERVHAFGSQDIVDQFDSLLLEDFQQEFEVFYSDETLTFFPYELILPCMPTEEGVEIVLAEALEQIVLHEGRVTGGFDIGRKKDTSELVLFEEDKYGVARMIFARTFDREEFDKQEQFIRRVLDTIPIARLSIDSSGLGMHMAENLERDYPTVVVREKFTVESKETWATDFKIRLQRKTVLMPRDRNLIAQIHSMRKSVTPHGTVTYQPERDSKHHADKFWACAMAVQKDRLIGRVPGIARVSVITKEAPLLYDASGAPIDPLGIGRMPTLAECGLYSDN